MSEHDEQPPAESAAPRTPAEAPAGEPPRTETLAYGPPPREGRSRRWANGGSVRMGVITLVAGLVGGLVGGGIVAAFSDHGGHDRSVPARFQQWAPYGGQGFGPRYWGPPQNGRWGPGRQFPQQPATPAPSPKATG